MNLHEDERMKKLLRQALPPVASGDGPGHNLWPAVLRRLDKEQPAPLAWLWLDWALAGALLLVVAAFPASIPVFLYYL